MRSLNREEVVHNDTSQVYECSGPMSGMYLLESAESRKLITPANLRRHYSFLSTGKAVALYTSPKTMIGRYSPNDIKDYMFDQITELSQEVQFLYWYERKIYRINLDDLTIMLIKPGRGGVKLWARYKDIAPSHRRYIEKRYNSFDVTYLDSQFTFTDLTTQTKEIIQSIIKDIIFRNQRRLKNGKNINK